MSTGAAPAAAESPLQSLLSKSSESADPEIHTRMHTLHSVFKLPKSIFGISAPFTLFENYSKCRIWYFWILAFSTNFCPIRTVLSGNTVWPQASGFQKLAKLTIFWHFLSTFVHSKCKRNNVEWDFFCYFQTPCAFTAEFMSRREKKDSLRCHSVTRRIYGRLFLASANTTTAWTAALEL